VLRILVSRELKEFKVTAKVCEGVVGLSIPEAEFEIWNS
jgi:hypothetical protein